MIMDIMVYMDRYACTCICSIHVLVYICVWGQVRSVGIELKPLAATLGFSGISRPILASLDTKGLADMFNCNWYTSWFCANWKRNAIQALPLVLFFRNKAPSLENIQKEPHPRRIFPLECFWKLKPSSIHLLLFFSLLLRFTDLTRVKRSRLSSWVFQLVVIFTEVHHFVDAVGIQGRASWNHPTVFFQAFSTNLHISHLLGHLNSCAVTKSMITKSVSCHHPRCASWRGIAFSRNFVSLKRFRW